MTHRGWDWAFVVEGVRVRAMRRVVRNVAEAVRRFLMFAV
jgi:hypothetical protein